MVINIDAFKKSFTDPTKDTKANIIHRKNDKLNGQKPIEFIASTNPIVIIDEPQSVDNTDKSKVAIETLNPLCRLRYSATHIEKHNLMYKLDSIDAYEQKLVKQIEVANVKLDEAHNNAYIKVISIKANPRSAKIEIDINNNGKTSRKSITINSRSDLYELSHGRDVYDGYTINDIYIEKDNEYIEFGNGVILKLKEVVGDVDNDSIKRLQIRKTIEEHLDKELRLNPKDIKVLSLFFLDRVGNYRQYDEDNNPINGKFANWFEEEYLAISKKIKYKDLNLDSDISKIHNGYFSTDKKGIVKDSSSNAKGELKGNKDDEDTFSLIMKDKEKLLSFESPLRFIFSHSALKEGWDNPNVFQICTLNETNSSIKKRQEIGRGLRICVNQEGERVQGFDINTLTVMANESYEDFAKGLQEEYKNDAGIIFENIEKYIKNADDKITVKLNKEVFIADDFKELWDKIKYKTTYKVDFDIEDLINTCAKEIENEATVGKIKYLYTKATNKITKVGVEIDEDSLKEQYINSEVVDYKLPDIITYLQNETKLKRCNIVDILVKSNKLQSFKNNPQKFIDKIIEIIKKTMSMFIVDGIKYQKLGDEFYYAQECFEEKELTGYLSTNLIKNIEEKAIYNYTIYDSEIEKSFAKKFNDSQNVKLFTKLPSWFKINTPLGGYNPDWAVLIDSDSEEKLYFVVESKGSDLGLDIKNMEKAKIDCGVEHFKAISEDIKFIQSDTFDNLKEHF
jgi:type III restriction enzyme